MMPFNSPFNGPTQQCFGKLLLGGTFKFPDKPEAVDGVVDMTDAFNHGGLPLVNDMIQHQIKRGWLPAGDAWVLSYHQPLAPVAILQVFWGPEPEIERMNMELTPEDKFKMYELRQAEKTVHDLAKSLYDHCDDQNCTFCESDDHTEESV